MKARQSRIALLAMIGFAAACAGKDAAPYLGKWNGKFVVESAGEDKDLARNELKGFLQLYRTGNRFTLHLSGEQQSIDAKGSWKVEGKRITLHTKDLTIDDFGGEAKRDLRKKYIPADDVRKAYGGNLVLDAADDAKHLRGLTTNVGPLIGHHEFEKVTNEYTY